MTDIDTALGWRGHEMIDRDGDKIGRVAEIYLDEDTGEPEWAAVKTGLFGTRQSFVPIGRATVDGDIVRVPYEKEQVKGAPSVDPEQRLSQSEEAELYEHYGLDYSEAASSSGLGEDHPAERREGAPGAGTQATRDDATGTDADSDRGSRSTGRALAEEGAESPPASAGDRGDDDAMVRSEEEVDIGTETRPRERVRLKKYVVTDQVTKTVPVQREEVRLERQPVPGSQAEDSSSRREEERD